MSSTQDPVDIDDAIKKKIEEAALHLIKKCLNHEMDAFVDDEDTDLLWKYPQEALFAFQRVLPVDGEEPKTTLHGTSEPELCPEQIFNNINLFERMSKEYMPLPFLRVQPKSLNDVINTLQKAGVEKRQVKAVGACYSFSDIAFSDGYIMEMNKYLHNILEIDETLLKDESLKNTLCKMEAGTLIESILEHLWPSTHRDKTDGYRTMLNTTGYSGLSIAGTTGCAAHGSGIDKPPMTDCIASIHLVTLDEYSKVVQYQIEPTEGITDPKRFKELNDENIILIQDDDYFYATTVHLGCMGVVYSYIIRVQPAFYLQEDRYIQSWDATKSDISQLVQRNNLDPSDPEALHSFEIWVSPYVHWHCVYSVVSTYKLAQPPRKSKRPRALRLTPHENDIARRFVLDISSSHVFHALFPFIMAVALKATTEGNPVTMPSTEALCFGSPNSIKVLTSDNGIDATNIHSVCDAIDDMIKCYNDAAQVDYRSVTTAPFSMRFTAPSKSFLAMQYGRPTCMIETPLLLGTHDQYKTLKRIREMTQAKYKSRPHWGQINDMDFDKLDTLYPDSYAKFTKAYAKFNVSGIFTGVFGSQISGC